MYFWIWEFWFWTGAISTILIILNYEGLKSCTSQYNVSKKSLLQLYTLNYDLYLYKSYTSWNNEVDIWYWYSTWLYSCKYSILIFFPSNNIRFRYWDNSLSILVCVCPKLSSNLHWSNRIQSNLNIKGERKIVKIMYSFFMYDLLLTFHILQLILHWLTTYWSH